MRRKPSARRRVTTDAFLERCAEIDALACGLHNLGASCAGNTQDSDIEWLARWLYTGSNIGLGSVGTMPWSISNDEFERLRLTPDRAWTGKRWETLSSEERQAWLKLARLCLMAMPHIAERIGHRFMDQAKALRVLKKAADCVALEWEPQTERGRRA